MADPVTPAELAGLWRRPPERIVDFFEKKGYQISFDWREVWSGEHARAFTVAKAMRRDVLDLLRQGVDQAALEGWSKDRFIREMTPRLKAAGWWGRGQVLNPNTGLLETAQLGSAWRLETIYRTNQTTAFNRGRYQTQIKSTKRRPFWQYDARNDSLTRETHRDLDNRVYRHDDPIWATIYPPNGFNCRCIVRALTEAQVKRQGLPISSSKRLPEPKGFPDEGWDYNPGTETQGAFKKRLNKPKKKPPAIPAKPKILDLRTDTKVWSTMSTGRTPITSEAIAGILSQVPGAQKQVKQLFRFLEKRKVGSLFATATETRMPGLRSSRANSIRADFNKYMTTERRYISKPPSRLAGGSGAVGHRQFWTSKRSAGYTWPNANHVVVRVPKTRHINNVDPKDLKGIVRDAIATRQAENHTRDFSRYVGAPAGSRNWLWTTSQIARDNTVLEKRGTSYLITWIHEMGHRVQFWAEAENLGVDLTRAITAYGSKNNKELFAESFVAWVLDRKALLAWDKDLTLWIDNAIKKAIQDG